MATPLYSFSGGQSRKSHGALCETAKYEVKEVLRESGEPEGEILYLKINKEFSWYEVPFRNDLR